MLGGDGSDRVAATAFVSNNVVAVGGAFEQILVLGTNTFQSAGGQDGFLAVLTDGQVEWATRIGGSGLDGVDALCVGTNGSIYAAGRFANTITVAGIQLTATAGSDGFLAAFSRTGEFQWVRQLSGNGDEFFSAIVSNGTNVFAVGSFTQNATLAGQTFSLSVSGGGSLIVANFTSTGDFKWAQRVGSSQSIQPACVAVTSAGSLAVGGRFSGNITFPTELPIASADYDGFLVQYSSTGTYVRRTILSGPGFDEITDAKGQADGSVIVVGNFESGAALAGQPLPTGVAGGVLARIDVNGNSSVARVLPTLTTRSLAIGKRGVIHVGGICQGDFSIGTQSFAAPSGVSVFVLSGALSGPVLGATIISGDGFAYLFHMDGFEDQLALAGYGFGNVTVDGQTISLSPVPAGLNGFAVELSPPSLALKLTLSAPQNALLSWPLYYYDATLERTDSLVQNPWSTLSISRTTNANRIEASSVLTGSKGFHRLKW